MNSNNRNNYEQEENVPYGEELYSDFVVGKKKTRLWSVVAFILGVLSVSTFSFSFTAIVLGILAIIFSIVSRKSLGYFDGFCIAAIITGIFGILFGGTVILIINLIAGEGVESFFDIFKESYDGGINGI